MNSLQLIYPSSLIYPKDEEKRRNIHYLCLLEVLKQLRTRPCRSGLRAAHRRLATRAVPSSNALWRRCQRVTKEEGMKRVQLIWPLLPAEKHKGKMGNGIHTRREPPALPGPRAPGAAAEPRPAQPVLWVPEGPQVPAAKRAPRRRGTSALVVPVV